MRLPLGRARSRRAISLLQRLRQPRSRKSLKVAPDFNSREAIGKAEAALPDERMLRQRCQIPCLRAEVVVGTAPITGPQAYQKIESAIRPAPPSMAARAAAIFNLPRR